MLLGGGRCLVRAYSVEIRAIGREFPWSCERCYDASPGRVGAKRETE